MSQVPQTLMRGDEALHVPPPCAVRRRRAPRKHLLQYHEQLFGNLVVGLITGMVESDEDLVGQPATVTRDRAMARLTAGMIVRRAKPA